MTKEIVIAPTDNQSGDWTGFERVIDSDDEKQIEEACEHLEEFLKENL